MKQKYTIVIDEEENTLLLREFAELDKDMLSLLCEQRYDRAAVEAAMAEGNEALMSLLRTKNMYPPSSYMEKMIEAVKEVCGPDASPSSEILFDDSELFNVESDEIDALADLDEESSDIDDLLEEDALEDDFVGDSDISNIGSNSSIKIADDDSLDIEDET
ncbi:MAG: hypothetical protein V2I97_18160 [Desulfococcaceae bacterium]|jgi:hypothetical protein|nr:hypothetical protein [Desulfococcaceae bacterium]